MENCPPLKKKLSIFSWPQFLRSWLLLFIVTIFLLLIGQKARTSGCDWFVPLSECTSVRQKHFVIGHCPLNDFAGRLRKDKVLNEPIIVFFL